MTRSNIVGSLRDLLSAAAQAQIADKGALLYTPEGELTLDSLVCLVPDSADRWISQTYAPHEEANAQGFRDNTGLRVDDLERFAKTVRASGQAPEPAAILRAVQHYLTFDAYPTPADLRVN